VSWPTYDNERFSRFIPSAYYDQLFNDGSKPLLNQAISGQHPPGSVFKIVPAAGALQDGVITPDRKLDDPGKIVIENRYFPNDPGQSRTVVCWLYTQKGYGHGPIDMIHAIAQSCSVYFYKIGGGYAPDNLNGLDIEGLYKYANMFGYNRRTGVELPGELKGLIPDRDYKRINIGENWSTGDTYIAAIGQGYVLATPMQVIDSVTPFLNNGMLIKPTLIKQVTDGEGNIVPVAQSYAADTYRDFVPVGTSDSYQLSPFVVKYRDADPTTPEIMDPVTVDPQWLSIVRKGMEEVYITGTPTSPALRRGSICLNWCKIAAKRTPCLFRPLVKVVPPNTATTSPNAKAFASSANGPSMVGFSATRPPRTPKLLWWPSSTTAAKARLWPGLSLKK